MQTRIQVHILIHDLLVDDEISVCIILSMFNQCCISKFVYKRVDEREKNGVCSMSEMRFVIFVSFQKYTIANIEYNHTVVTTTKYNFGVL